MGECLIIRRGGETYKLPILDATYPKDITLTVLEGNTGSATFQTVISEPGNPAIYTYQWYVDGVAVEGATSSSYTREGLTTTGTHSVYCEVTNKKGTVTTRIATLNVTRNFTPVLDSSYPQDASVSVNSSVTSKVQIKTAGSPNEYTYQWYKNGDPIEGATNSSCTYTVDEIGTVNVYCEVTNSAGTVTSRTATITATPVYVFNNGVFSSGSYDFSKNNSEDRVTLENGTLILYDEGIGRCIVWTTEKFDFTNRKTLYFTVPQASMGSTGGTFYFGGSDTQSDLTFIASTSTKAYTSTVERTFSVDVSNITGSHYIKVAISRDVYYSDWLYVSQIYFG